MTDSGINPLNGKPVRRSTGFTGFNTIFAPDGGRYMTRLWFGRLRLHVFHRGDTDQDPHDHPWSFVTFPFTSYVEEVTTKRPVRVEADWIELCEEGTLGYECQRVVVRAWRFHYRPATHCHRVLGVYSGKVWDHAVNEIVSCSPGRFKRLRAERGAEVEPFYDTVGDFDGPPGKIVTLVWRGKLGRQWGFLKHRDGRWCWQHWKEYVLSGGKDAPCQ